MANEKKKGQYKEYLTDKKTILTMVALSFAFLFVIALTFGVQFVLLRLDDSKFWTDLAISFVLCVYCLYFGIPEAKNLYEKKIGGRYQVAYTKFKEIRATNSKKDNDFNQWLDIYYQKSKRDYYESVLSINGIKDSKVLDLDLYELDCLEHAYKKTWEGTEFEGREPTYFRALTQEQIKIVKMIYRGEIQFAKLPNEYFKTLNGKMVSSEYIERQRQQKRQTLKYALLITYRILLVFVIAFVFSLFGFEYMENQKIVENLTTLLFRLWTMISAFTYGFAVGRIITTDKCNVIEYKTRINELFADGGFVGISEEELAKAEYEDYEKSIREVETIEKDMLWKMPIGMALKGDSNEE